MKLPVANRQTLLVLIAGLAVLALAADFLVISPLLQSWKSRGARIESLRKSVTDGQALLRRENGLRSEWNRMRTNTLSREVSIAQSQVLRAFERWSRESGVAIGGIRPQWKRAENDLQTLECRADVTGSLSALAHFLHQTELDPLGVRVDSVELTARDKTGTQLALALQVSALQIGSPSR